MEPIVSGSKMAHKPLQRSASQREVFQENFFKTVEDGVLSSPLAKPIADQDLKMLRMIKSGVLDVMIDEEGAVVRNATYEEEPKATSPSPTVRTPNNPYYNVLMNGVIKRDDNSTIVSATSSDTPTLRHSKSTAALPTIHDVEPTATTSSAHATKLTRTTSTPITTTTKRKIITRTNTTATAASSKSGPHIVLGKELYHPKFDMTMAEIAISPYNVKPETPYDPKDIDFAQEIRYMKYHNTDLAEATAKVAADHNKPAPTTATKPKGDKFIVDMKTSSPFFAANGKLRAKGTICNATPLANNIENKRVLYSTGYVNSHKQQFEKMSTLFSRGRSKAEAERRKQKHNLPEKIRAEMQKKFEQVLKYRTDYSLGEVTFSTARWKQQKAKRRHKNRHKIVPTAEFNSTLPRSDAVAELDKEEQEWMTEMRTGRLVRRGTKEGLFSTRDLVELSVSTTTSSSRERHTAAVLEADDVEEITSEDELINGIADVIKHENMKIRPASAGIGGISKSHLNLHPTINRPGTATSFIPPKTESEKSRVTISRFAPTKTWTAKMNF